jgi:hypothetical protein
LRRWGCGFTSPRERARVSACGAQLSIVGSSPAPSTSQGTRPTACLHAHTLSLSNAGLKRQNFGRWKQDVGAGTFRRFGLRQCNGWSGKSWPKEDECVGFWSLQFFAGPSVRSAPPTLTIATIGITRTRQATSFTALRAGTRASRRSIRRHVVTAVSPTRSTIAGHALIMAASLIGIDALRRVC